MQELNLGVADASYNYGFIYGNTGDEVGAYNNQGIAYCHNGDYDQAIASFNKAMDFVIGGC